MNLGTFWLVVPLIGLGLSGFGGLALWITHSHAKPDHHSDSAVGRL